MSMGRPLKKTIQVNLSSKRRRENLRKLAEGCDVTESRYINMLIYASCDRPGEMRKLIENGMALERVTHLLAAAIFVISENQGNTEIIEYLMMSVADIAESTCLSIHGYLKANNPKGN